MAKKYYVVWEGGEPGIYLSWEDCQEQISGYPHARYKSFNSKEEAVKAYRGDGKNDLDLLRAIVSREKENVMNMLHSNNDVVRDAIAVDGACSTNPGPVEYRGVSLVDGKEIFHVGPLAGGTNNIGEYLAIVHALAYLDKQGNTTTTVYSDSKNAMAWVKARKCRTKAQRTPDNAYTFELIERADRWLQSHPVIPNPVLKWDTANWGEIPADFGRK